MATNASRVLIPINKSAICQLCDKEATVKWKCITCDEAMCISCKTTHLRSKVSRNHEVSEIIKTEKMDLSASIDPSMCTEHPKENVNMYCMDCSTLVCPDCITDQHNKHSLCKISKIAKEKQQELEKIIIQAERKADGYETTIQHVQRNKSEYEKDSTAVVQQLQSTRDELKEEVDQVIDEMIKDFEKRQKADGNKLKNKECQLKISISAMRGEVKSYEEEINSMGDIKTIRNFQALKQSLNNYDECTKWETIPSPKFVRNTTSKDVLRNLIGQINPSVSDETKIELPHEAPSTGEITNVKLVSTFNCPKGTQFNLFCPVSPDKAWFTRISNPDVYLISNSGEVEKVVHTDFNVFNIAVNKSGTLFVISRGGYKLKRLTHEKFEDVYIPTLTRVYCIHFTLNDEILVGGRDDTKDRHNKIMWLSSDYKVLQTICEDPVTNKQTFDVPASVTQSTNGNIYITNYSSKNKKLNMKAIDKTGHHVFTYPTPGSITLDKEVKVGLITEDKQNDILVSDTNNYCIHVLDRAGNFKQFLDTKQHGLGLPHVVASDTSGNIWIMGHKDKTSKEASIIIVHY